MSNKKEDISDWQDDFEDASSLGDYIFVAKELIREGFQNVYAFFSLHPVPVGIRNNISVILGEGGTIGLTHPVRSLRSTKEDVLQVIGW